MTIGDKHEYISRVEGSLKQAIIKHGDTALLNDLYHKWLHDDCVDKNEYILLINILYKIVKDHEAIKNDSKL